MRILTNFTMMYFIFESMLKKLVKRKKYLLLFILRCLPGFKEFWICLLRVQINIKMSSNLKKSYLLTCFHFEKRLKQKKSTKAWRYHALIKINWDVNNLTPLCARNSFIKIPHHLPEPSISMLQIKGGEDWVGASLGKFYPFCIYAVK